MWLEIYGERRIRERASRDPSLRAVLEASLEGIYRLLSTWGQPFHLEALVTKSGENMIRMRVAYRTKAERDAIWDRAAEIMEQARGDREVDILCGIYRLIGDAYRCGDGERGEATGGS